MHTYVSSEPALEPQVNVAAMAGIVQELLACKQNGQCDRAWLWQRTTAAQLCQHECTALEALRVQLYECRAILGDHVNEGYWN